MAVPPKKKKCPPEGAPEWMTTYGDMVTLLLTFFVMMYTTAQVDGSKLKLIIAAFSGLGVLSGGNTLQAGQLAELGNNIESLPSVTKGRALDQARKRAISQFEPEIRSNKVRISEDERGLIISLAADSFFPPASAEVDIDAARETLRKASSLLISLPDRTFRIEGHTDNIPTDDAGPWETNWELSTARATNVLHYLVDFGVRETQFQVAGFADTVPIAANETAEGRAYNRRVDIVILTEGHL
ncbi:MAG: flagellar motor protein MotB [Spirochaetales bacterium]|nr:flagellar motor protein MotB [Spirochaetales bacterium]